MKHLFRIAAATLVTVLASPAFAELPVASKAMINPTPPSAKVAAGYVNLHNPGGDSLEISAVSSPAINRVEIHKTEMHNDVMSMRELPSVTIPAGESVQFTHGGLHIMLMDLEAPMIPGDVVPLVFHTNNGDLMVDFKVAEEIQMPKNMQDSTHSAHGKMKH